MTWLAVRLFLGGWLKRIWTFALSNLWRTAAIVLALVAVLQWQDARHWHGQSDRWEALFRGEKKAFAETVANFRKAQREAEEADKAHAKRVEADQNRISKEKSDEYQARIADLRARLERLRHGQAGQAHSGGSGPTSVPGLPDAPGRPDAAPAPGSDDALFNCAANAIQLDELIKWVRGQQAVPRDAPN